MLKPPSARIGAAPDLKCRPSRAGADASPPPASDTEDVEERPKPTARPTGRKAAKAAKKLEQEETAVIIEGHKEMIAIAKEKNKRLANLVMLAIMRKDILNLPDIVWAFYRRKQRKYVAEMSEDEEDVGDQD
ncbi:hypothetical protein BDK51DRAFT_51316 [Blyttiomyces helicus]|uniref:No apical meristem-associated C-terminal domain-containing protein n=1 Tax=Blyttiomyces helicus TaxID=388810 RepID=A0A4P9W8I7_9FUNG|nr:hypothetical protein BDK51DRAFT_51316 [Blyttiomyces helicus]|eukprot:RKO88422.1 hypothetical protein BDK51DRAFT_51316 [Blyttiomyces helicus]